VPDKSVLDGVLIYGKTQKSGSIQRILVPNENVCLNWSCRKREFTVLLVAEGIRIFYIPVEGAQCFRINESFLILSLPRTSYKEDVLSTD
jgi:hypothetical protein